MDQRSDYIRQDIESTRAALDDKLDTLETKARQAFDLKHHVSERPWMMLGAAVAAGYVLGSLGGSDDDTTYRYEPATSDYRTAATSDYKSRYTPSSQYRQSKVDSFLSQFDDEIDMLKTAAISTLTGFLRDTIREYVPALGQQLDETARQRGKQVSTATGASRYYTTRESAVNTESIPTTTSYGSNMAASESHHAEPYYPPGSSGTPDDRDYVKTYHPPSETNRERAVGDEPQRY